MIGSSFPGASQAAVFAESDHLIVAADNGRVQNDLTAVQQRIENEFQNLKQNVFYEIHTPFFFYSNAAVIKVG